MSENPDTWFENYILDITEEPMKGELYTLFDGIYICFCVFSIYPVIDPFTLHLYLFKSTQIPIWKRDHLFL